MLKMKMATVAMGSLCLFAGASAIAGPNDYIRTPTVEYGEREIDFKTGSQSNRDGSSEAATSIGYGFTPKTWWFTELYAKYAKPPGESQSFDAWEWENRFQLTETGKYPVDVGFLLEIERPKDRTEGYEITYGPMFQAEWRKLQGNFNIFIKNTFALQRPLIPNCTIKCKSSIATQNNWNGVRRLLGMLDSGTAGAPHLSRNSKWGLPFLARSKQVPRKPSNGMRLF